MTNKRYGQRDAFAAVSISPDGNNYIQNGMGIRDYFAAAAMQGMVCNQGWGHDPEFISKKAVKFADALINELNNTDDKV